MKSACRLLLATVLAVASLTAQAFDHEHRAWSELVAKHVKVATDGHSSRVDYAGFAADRGAFDDPRIHAAVVCASVGCPMLRAEAFAAEKLETQLEDGMRRFLGDAARNRFDAASGKLQVSKLFDWYGDDFASGHQGFVSLHATFARYADQLAATPEVRERLRRGDYRLEYLDYDWRLNDSALAAKPAGNGR